MLVTLFEITIWDSALESINAQSPILVTLFGMTMLNSNKQPENAPSPILVTLFGTIMLVRKLHIEKALSHIIFVPSLKEKSPFKSDGAFNNFLPSLLYFIPHSSINASSSSSSVTSVDKSSNSEVILVFSQTNNLKEHAESSFLANASMKRE